MKKVILFILLIISFYHLHGQTSYNSDSTSFKVRKNAIYYQIGGIMVASLNYGRYISLSDKNGLVVSSGFCSTTIFGEGYSFVPCEENILFYIEGSYLRGGPKHFLEVGYSFEFTEPMHQPRVGYRLQGKRGFLFRGALMYLTRSTKEFYYGAASSRVLIFGLSFGYCF